MTDLQTTSRPLPADKLAAQVEIEAREVQRLERENARLRDAIRQHQQDVWGRGKVGHPEDVKLYRVLS